MALSQSREGNFNPTSPHSSSGVADSFKGTPDTRLTAFSPEDGSARSAKMTGSLSLISREAAQTKYPVSSPSSLDLSKKFYRSDLQLERDPFITAPGPTGKAAQKLSPTASAFFPLQNHPVSHDFPSEYHFPTKEKFREPLISSRSLTVGDQDPCYVHSLLSTDTGLSRCLVISRSDGGGLGELEIDKYISVSIAKFSVSYTHADELQDLEKAGIPCPGSRDIFACGGKVCVRFSNIRCACALISKARMGNRDWSVDHLTAREFSQVSSPIETLHGRVIY